MSRPKVITLTPTASDPNGLTTSETLVAARLSLMMNGTLATGYDRNGICASQTPTSSAAMTLNGAGGNDYNSVGGVIINLYAAGADSGRTFTIVGTDTNGRRITETITGPGAGLITHGTTRFYSITSVTPDAATAGAIEVGSSGIITLATPQHITITSGGDDTGDTFTVTGENRYGDVLTEAITGASGTAALGTKNFAKVYSEVSSGASAFGVEVGVNGLCESQWYMVNYRGPDFNVGFGVDISSGASLTYTVQHTFHNIQASGFAEDDATSFDHSDVATKTANADGNYSNPPTAMRLAITVHSSGSANIRIIQVGR